MASTWADPGLFVLIANKIPDIYNFNTFAHRRQLRSEQNIIH